MRKNIFIKVAGLLLAVALLASCDTASQEAEPVVSPDGYPKVTFATDFTGNSVTEGDTIIYTITMDKMLDRSVTFHVTQTGGDVVEHYDYDVYPGVMAPYTLQTTAMIVFYQDDVPEEEMTYACEIGATSLADKYLVHPDTENPTLDLTVTNVNDPTLLTVMFAWDTESDIDIVTWSDTPDYPATEWGADGATGNNPEIDMALWLADPVGDYYVNVMDWGEPPFNYVFTLGHPDQSIEYIEGTFDQSTKTYVMDLWMAWGGDGYPSYRVLKVVNDGSKFTVTQL